MPAQNNFSCSPNQARGSPLNELAESESGGWSDLTDYPKHVDPWVIGEYLRKGTSGHIKIAKHCHTGQFTAVKILPLQAVVNSRASLAPQQAKGKKQRLGQDGGVTNHPNIMPIYDVYEGDKQLYLILEYVEGGELFDFLVNRAGEHSRSLIQSFTLKLANWGMAVFAPTDQQLDTRCGSPHYTGPEIVNGLKYEGTDTNTCICGVILFALLTGRLPFNDKNIQMLLSKVKVGFIGPYAKG